MARQSPMAPYWSGSLNENDERASLPAPRGGRSSNGKRKSKGGTGKASAQPHNRKGNRGVEGTKGKKGKKGSWHRRCQGFKGRKGGLAKPGPLHPQEAGETVGKLGFRMVTWNIDGFNDPPRRLAILTYLWEHDVDLAILTESHLRDEDIFHVPKPGGERILRIPMQHYRVIHWRNRESAEERRSGGVLMVARDGVDCTLVPQELLPKSPISCCSVVINAVDNLACPFRLAGAYFPPPPFSAYDSRDDKLPVSRQRTLLQGRE